MHDAGSEDLFSSILLWSLHSISLFVCLLCGPRQVGAASALGPPPEQRRQATKYLAISKYVHGTIQIWPLTP